MNNFSKSVFMFFVTVAFNTYELQASQQYAWTKSPWTHPDETFLALEKKLDLSMKTNAQAKALVNAYKQKLKSSQATPEQTYNYAYAVVKYVKDFKNGSGDKSDLHEAVSILRQKNLFLSNSYRFVRLKYLIEYQAIPHKSLIPLGERLIQRSPKDWLSYTYLAVLYANYTANGQARSIALAERAINLQPKEALPYGALAYAYRVSALYGNKPSDIKNKASNYNLAIVNYEKYLQLSPPKAHYRKRIASVVQEMKKELAQIKR